VKLIKTAHSTLKACSEDVFAGRFDAAKSQHAEYKKHYQKLYDIGRGWRLKNPFEWLSRYWKTIPTPQTDEHDISEKDMSEIFKLLHKRATTQAANAFTVHPPRKLLDNPSLAKSADVIGELEDSIFSVVFQDGESRMMTLAELMVFTFHLLHLAHQMQEVNKMVKAVSPAPARINVTTQFSVEDVMKTEIVQTLLSTIDFSDVPSDKP
jgi:hypothetical protein